MTKVIASYYALFEPQGIGRKTTYIGFFALMIFSLFWLWKVEISQIGESLLILGFLMAVISRKATELKHDPLIYLFLAWLIIQVPVYLFAAKQFPEFSSEQITVSRHYTKIFMILVIAWWMAGSWRVITLMYALAFIGFFFGVLSSDQQLIETIQSAISRHNRIDFGYRNAQHLSVYSSFFFLAIIFLWKRVLWIFPGKLLPVGYTFITLWLLTSLSGLIASNTRATWLALCIVSIVACSFFLVSRHRIKKIQSQTKGSYGIILIASLLVVILFTAFKTGAVSFIEQRLTSERETIHSIIFEDTNEIPYTSIGIRVNTWVKAMEWIKEKPLLGWGPKSRKYLIETSDLPDNIRKRFGHFHNSYIEIMLAYGVVGSAIILLVCGIVGYRAFRSWRQGLIPTDIFYFLVSFFIYWSIVNLFESYIIYNTGYYINALVGGTAYTCYLAGKRKNLHNQEIINGIPPIFSSAQK